MVCHLVKNESGDLIRKGQAVYVSGTQTDGVDNWTRPTIELALANAEATSLVVGLAADDIQNGSWGFVMVHGNLRGISTSMYNEQDVLYLSETTPGGYTTTPPLPPNYEVLLGVVSRVDHIQGNIIVGIHGAHMLGLLHEPVTVRDGDTIDFSLIGQEISGEVIISTDPDNILTQGSDLALYVPKDILTSISYDSSTRELTYIDEEGSSTIIDLSGLISSVIDHNSGGSIIATHTSGDGTSVNIRETITTLIDNLDDTFTYTNEVGTITIIDTGSGYSWDITDGLTTITVSDEDTLTFVDGDTINFTLSAGPNITGEVIISSDGGNTLTLGTDNALFVPAGGGYSWDLYTDTVLRDSITIGERVNFIGGTEIDVTYGGTNDVTIGFTGTYDNYDHWDLTADSGTVQVNSTDNVNIIGGNGLVTSLVGSSLTINALTDDGVQVVSDNITLDFNGLTEETTIGQPSLDYFAFYDASAVLHKKINFTNLVIEIESLNPSNWALGVDSDEPGGPYPVVGDNVVKILGGTNVTTSRSGFEVTIDATDTNTTYSASADGGLDETATVFELDIPNLPALTDIGVLADTDTFAVYNLSALDHEEATMLQLKTYIGADNYGSWDIDADSGGPKSIASTEVLSIDGGKGLATTLSGASSPFTLDIDYDFTDPTLAVGGALAGGDYFLIYDQSAINHVKIPASTILDYTILNDAYAVSWNGSAFGTDRNSIYDKIEALKFNFSDGTTTSSDIFVSTTSGNDDNFEILGGTGITSTVSGDTVTLALDSSVGGYVTARATNATIVGPDIGPQPRLHFIEHVSSGGDLIIDPEVVNDAIDSEIEITIKGTYSEITNVFTPSVPRQHRIITHNANYPSGLSDVTDVYQTLTEIDLNDATLSYVDEAEATTNLDLCGAVDFCLDLTTGTDCADIITCISDPSYDCCKHLGKDNLQAGDGVTGINRTFTWGGTTTPATFTMTAAGTGGISTTWSNTGWIGVNETSATSLVHITADQANRNLFELENNIADQVVLFKNESTSQIRFSMYHSNGTEYYRFSPTGNGWWATNGNIGFHETSPAEKVHITGTTRIDDTAGGSLKINRVDATTIADELLGEILFDSTDSLSSTDASAAIRAYASQSHSAAGKGGYLGFETKATGTADSGASVEHMRLEQGGRVKLGETTTAATGKLHVEVTDPTDVFRAERTGANPVSFVIEVGGNNLGMRIDSLNDSWIMGADDNTGFIIDEATSFGSSPSFFIEDATGNIGIKNTSPSGYGFNISDDLYVSEGGTHNFETDGRWLDTYTRNQSGGHRAYSYHSSNNVGPSFIGAKRGTVNDVDAVLASDHIILSFEGQAYTGTNIRSGASFQFRTNGTWTGTSRPSKMEFNVCPGGTNVQNTMIESDGTDVALPEGTLGVGMQFGQLDAEIHFQKGNSTAVPAADDYVFIENNGDLSMLMAGNGTADLAIKFNQTTTEVGSFEYNDTADEVQVISASDLKIDASNGSVGIECGTTLGTNSVVVTAPRTTISEILQLRDLAADPSSNLEGDIWWNSNATAGEELRVYDGTAVKYITLTAVTP